MSWLRNGSRSPAGRRRSGRALLAAGLGAVLALAAPATAQEQPTHPTFPPDFAITNARVVPVSGRVIERGTVVVRGGVIRAVGANVQTPNDLWVIDGAGLTVYPGLIDAFTTLGQSQPRGAMGPQMGGPQGGGAASFAAQQQPHSWGAADRPGTFTWLTAADELDAADRRIEKWREAGFTAALTTRPQGLLTGEAAVISLAGERGRELVVAPAVAQRVNLNSRGAGYGGYPGSLMGVLAYIKQFHYDARHYAQVWSAYDRDPRGRARPEYDRALEPFRTVRPLLFPADDRVEVQRALKLGQETGAPIIIYGAQQAYDAASLLRGTPVLVNLDWPRAPRENDPNNEPALAALRSWEHSPSTPAALQQAGVRFAFYSGGNADPGEFRQNVKRAIDAGLAPDAALRALTLGAAEILGVADRMGSIETGKLANLVLTDGDILDPATRIRHVIVDGRPFELPAPTQRVASRPAGRAGDANAQGGTNAAGSAAAQAAPIAMTQNRGAYRTDGVTLIRNATILTATGPALEGHDLLVRDGKIATLGKNLSAPRGAHVVDATGLYVTPGIIDAHSHTAAFAINEGSVAVSAMVGMKDVINPGDINIYRALAGGVTTINLLHGSANPIGGRNAVLKLRWGADADDLIMQGSPEGIKFALGENTKRTRNPARYPNSRMGVQDVVRQAFLDAREYMKEWEAYEQARRRDKNAIAPRRDLELETLAEILRGERDVHAHSYRADEILQLMRVAEEFGFRLKTLQHVLEGYKVADEIAKHGAGASTFSDWWAYKVEANDAIPHNAAIMVERGVVVSINSDSDEEMRHLNQEAAKTIKWGGLSELDALKLITLNPAIQLGIQDRVGSIEVGKDADLVLFKGHPFSMQSAVQQTYVDGKLYFDLELDRQRQAELEREKEALIKKHLPGQAPATQTVTQAAQRDQEVER